MNNWQNKALKLLTISAFPLLATATLAKPSNASTFDVACKADGDTPTIVASLTEKGTDKEDTILQFLPEYFSPNDAINNCEYACRVAHWGDSQLRYDHARQIRPGCVFGHDGSRAPVRSRGWRCRRQHRDRRRDRRAVLRRRGPGGRARHVVVILCMLSGADLVPRCASRSRSNDQGGRY